MSTNRRHALVLKGLADLNPGASAARFDTSPTQISQPPGTAPDLEEVLGAIGPLPREALFLGQATDGLPVLLNLHDPNPGPVLIAADAGAGKTAFLKLIAAAARRTHDARDLQLGVITAHPEEWQDIEAASHQVGIFQVQDDGARQFVLSLARWAHENKQQRQAVLMLIDDLESIAGLDFETVQSFRWLLLRGPARRVWPIIGLQASRYGQVIAWLQNFRSRIFGRIADEEVAAALGAGPEAGLAELQPGLQFALPESGKWLRFRLPSF